MADLSKIKQVNSVIWELPKSYKAGMRVPARIIATKKLLEGMDDGVFEQLTNVASLPGILNYALAMPDAHWGYGAPIGCVAAFDLDKGVIVPGIVGFDINCGVRLVKTNLTFSQLQPKIEELVNTLFRLIPAGVGAKGFLKLTKKEFNQVIVKGAGWAVEKGFGWPQDLESIEESGAISAADPDKISAKACDRGINQLGTLGSGNHYLEIQKVAEIFNPNVARKLGIDSQDQVVIMIHCGSRGFGHQVATDYLRIFEKAMEKYGILVTDKQLSSAPVNSSEGKNYYAAQAAASNLAFCNRQIIMHRVREGFSQVFAKSAEELGMNLVYDVAHNIAKIESHDLSQSTTDYSLQQKENKKTVDSLPAGKASRQKAVREVLVLRKGATRAFGAGNPALPKKYQDIGQPVIIGGSMETGSYLLIGLDGAEKISFASTAHGSGRRMSRTAARRQVQGRQLLDEMKKRGIYVQTASYAGLAEEAGLAYKDISEVVAATEAAGISAKVAKFVPVGNIKG